MIAQPEMKIKLSKLRDVVQENFRKGSIFRNHTYDALRQYVGHNFSEEGTNDRVLRNYIKIAVQIHARLLSAKMPRCNVTTPVQDLKVTAARATKMANAFIEQQGLAEVYREWVESALFGLGVVKVGWEEIDEEEINGEMVPVGEVFVENILQEDWVQDLRAKGRPWKTCAFMGHKIRMPLHEAKAREDWNADARKALTPTEESRHTEFGDPKVTNLSGGPDVNADTLYEEVELWEIFLVNENLTVTFSTKEGGAGISHFTEVDDTDVPLAVEEWTGPSIGTAFVGPYHFLGFDWPIGNSMPVPPVAHWRDIHELANTLMNKNARKALSQKIVHGYKPGQQEDAERIRDAGDNELVQMNDPEGVHLFEFPGIDQSLLAYNMTLDQNLDKDAGNLSALGGLGPQSETARQDEQALGQANAQIEDMKDTVFEAGGSVIKSILYHWWNDPVQDFEDVVVVTDTIAIPYNIPAEDRGEIWHDLNFETVLYSTEHMTPQQKTDFILQLTESPLLMQHLQMNGLAWDISSIIKMLAEYRNIPELLDVIVTQQGEYLHSAEAIGAQPANTTRTTERISRSQATPQGQDQMLQQMMLGASNGQQPQMGGMYN